MSRNWEEQLRKARRERDEIEATLMTPHDWWEIEMLKDDLALQWQLIQEAESMLGYKDCSELIAPSAREE